MWLIGECSGLETGINSSLSSLQPMGSRLVAMVERAAPPGNMLSFSMGGNIYGGIKAHYQLVCKQTHVHVSFQVSSVLRKCLWPQLVRYGSVRHASGFQLPTRTPHQGSSSIGAVRKDVRGLFACTEACACLQAELMSTSDINND